MAALRTREQARERLAQIALAQIEQMIPADPSQPLKGQTFRDFEMQGIELKPALLPAGLEELAGLSAAAQVTSAGRCPHCGAARTYLEAQVVKKEVRSPDGLVVLERQQARCRAGDGSFSPSGPRLVDGGAGAVDAAGGGAGGAGGGAASL